ARRILSLYQQFIRAATFFMAPRAAISQHYSKSIFRNAKAIYKDSLRSLPYADEPLRKDLRDSLRHYAVHYASILTPLHRVTRLGGYLWVPAFGVALFISDNVEYNESRLVVAILPTIAFGISVGLSIFLTRTIRRTAVAL